MKVMVTVQHPAHVHFYRHPIRELRSAGHDVWVFVRDKEITSQLLAAYDVPHRVLASLSGSLAGMATAQALYELRLLRRARRIEPDVITSIGGVAASHVASLSGARSVIFTDSEGTPANRLMVPFADVICTPRGLDADYGGAHRRYDGYHELAYLHPDRFEPADDLLVECGVDPDDRYFVLRFVAWNAHHDVGQEGFSRERKRELVSFLSERGEVYITSEDELPAEFEPYRLPVPPERMHDLLARADLYVGDSQTMATEAAVLGTPAVRSNSFAGDGDMSNFLELDREYDLLVSTPDEAEAVRAAKSLADDPQATGRWQRRRDRLVADKIDVTEYIVETLEQEGGSRRAARRTGGVRVGERTADDGDLT